MHREYDRYFGPKAPTASKTKRSGTEGFLIRVDYGYTDDECKLGVVCPAETSFADLARTVVPAMGLDDLEHLAEYWVPHDHSIRNDRGRWAPSRAKEGTIISLWNLASPPSLEPSTRAKSPEGYLRHLAMLREPSYWNDPQHTVLDGLGLETETAPLALAELVDVGSQFWLTFDFGENWNFAIRVVAAVPAEKLEIIKEATYHLQQY